MNLGTIGLVFKFALNLENENLNLIKLLQEVDLRESLMNQYSKRIKKLKRLRKENITEMILEPIQDFDSTEYKLEDEKQMSSTFSLKEKIIFNEIIIQSFYNKAAEKSEFLSEVAIIFQNFALEHKKNNEKFEKT